MRKTGLDYFGARYWGSALGRYTSPDEPFADQRSTNPQSWNLYTHAANNPLKYIDRTGKAIKLSGDHDARKKRLAALQAAAGKKAGAYFYDDAEKDKDGNLTGRHFVGILGGGPSGKGPDFGSINAVAKDIAGVVADTQIAQLHVVDAGQSFLPMGAGHDAASLKGSTTGYTSPFNAPAPIQIRVLNPDSALTKTSVHGRCRTISPVPERFRTTYFMSLVMRLGRWTSRAAGTPLPFSSRRRSVSGSLRSAPR